MEGHIVYMLDELLKERGITASRLKTDTGVRLAAFKDGCYVHTEMIDRVCDYLNVEPYEVFEVVFDEDTETEETGCGPDERRTADGL